MRGLLTSLPDLACQEGREGKEASGRRRRALANNLSDLDATRTHNLACLPACLPAETRLIHRTTPPFTIFNTIHHSTTWNTPNHTKKEAMASNCPIPVQRLKQICNDACDAAISSASVYEHSQTQAWNNAIIGNILQKLIAEETSSDNTPPKHKFIVNTTIIQHLSDPRSGASEGDKKVGRRGMHSASGAFWNNEKDGMWSHKYEGGEGKGMDIVVSVMWVAV
ncbi:hypothetical protein AC579_583 [Pseudocercospora musae]|uniref:Topoisomerase I damage affected protein 2 n=1 Tax=Pseudocercospora musae TaxID=113226 RepID=A0A139ICP4_9PEZI|nr:hypothetical protein AC579_583 [Pseudocercospora musae]